MQCQKPEAFNTKSVCGNGLKESGEECDDGNNINNDGCSSDCQLEIIPLCGDSIVQNDETCDDGNTANNDGCSAFCKIELCGDGIIQTGEMCDDGNQVPNDSCSNECTVPICKVEKIYYDSGVNLYEFNTVTGEETLLCEHSLYLGDIGFTPEGKLIGLNLNDCWLYEIDLETCTTNQLFNIDTSDGLVNVGSCNSLSFFPNSLGVYGRNPTGRIFAFNLESEEYFEWGSIEPYRPGGDYIYFQGKVYVLTQHTFEIPTVNLLEVTVDENLSFVEYKDLGALSGIEEAYGLSFADGFLWFGTNSGKIYRIDNLETLDYSEIGSTSEKVYGLSSFAESQNCQ